MTDLSFDDLVPSKAPSDSLAFDDLIPKGPATPNGMYKFPDGTMAKVDMDPNETSPLEVQRMLSSQGQAHGGMPTPYKAPPQTVSFDDLIPAKVAAAPVSATVPTPSQFGASAKALGTEAIDALSAPHVTPYSDAAHVAASPASSISPTWAMKTGQPASVSDQPTSPVSDAIAGGLGSNLVDFGAGLQRLVGAGVAAYQETTPGMTDLNSGDLLFGASDKARAVADSLSKQATALSPTGEKAGNLIGTLGSFLALPEAELEKLGPGFSSWLAKMTSNPTTQAFIEQSAKNAAANLPRAAAMAIPPNAVASSAMQQVGASPGTVAALEATGDVGGTLQGVLPVSAPLGPLGRMVAGLVMQQTVQKGQQELQHAIAPDQIAAPNLKPDFSDPGTALGPLLGLMGGHSSGEDPYAALSTEQLKASAKAPNTPQALKAAAVMELARRGDTSLVPGYKPAEPVRTPYVAPVQAAAATPAQPRAAEAPSSAPAAPPTAPIPSAGTGAAEAVPVAPPASPEPRAAAPQKLADPVTPAAPAPDGFLGSTRHSILDQHAQTDPELAALLAKARVDGGPVPDASTFAEAKRRMDADPEYANKLATDINSGAQRRVDTADTAVLAREQSRLNNEIGNADQTHDDTKTANNPFGNPETAKALTDLRERYIQNSLAGNKVGSEHGSGLRAQQFLSDDDLNLQHVLSMGIAAKRERTGDPAATLDPKEEMNWRQAYEDLQKKNAEMAEHQQKTQDAQTNEGVHEALAQTLRQMTGELPAAGKRGSFLDRMKARADASQKALDALSGVPSNKGQSGALDLRALPHILQIGAYKFAKGLHDFGAWVGDMKTQLAGKFGIGETDWQKLYDRSKELHDLQAAKSGVKVKVPPTPDQVSATIDHANLSRNDVADIVKSHIQAGVHGEDALMKATHATLAKDHPEMTERDVRRMFSDYGKATFPSRDVVKMEMAEVRSLTRMQESIDRMKEGLPALHTGLQREKATQNVRERQALLNDALKAHQDKFGTTPEKLSSYQDVRRRVYNNQIDDLNKQIATGERPVARKPAPDLDKQNEDLKFARDHLVAERDKLNHEQGAAHDKAIARLQKQIDDISKPKAGVEAKPSRVDTVELHAMRDRLKAMQDARDLFKPKPERKTDEDRRIASLEKQIADLKSGAVKPGPKEGPVSARVDALEKERAALIKARKPAPKSDEEVRIDALKTRLKHIQDGQQALSPLHRTETPEEHALKEQIRIAEMNRSPSPAPTLPKDPNIARNQTVQKQLQRRLEQLQETARTGVFPKRGEPRPFAADAKTKQLQIEVGRAGLRAYKAKNELLKKSEAPVMRVWNKIMQAERGLVFASPTIAPKLALSSILKPVFSGVEAISAQAHRLIPGTGKLFANSDYYRGGLGSTLRSEASAAFHTFGKETAVNALKKLGGQSDLEAQMAYHLMQNPDVINPKSPDYIPGLKGLRDSMTGADANAWHDHLLEVSGRIHDAIKTPAEINEYHRATVRYTDSEVIRAKGSGMTPAEVAAHMSDPRTQGMIQLKAYAKAQEAKYQEDSALASHLSRAIKDGYESESGVANVWAGIKDAVTPAKKVPVNILGDLTSYIPLVGYVKAAMRGWKARGDNFTKQDADYMIKVMSKQPVGMALATFATLFASGFGGQWHEGDKKKGANDVPYGEANLDGLRVPAWSLHQAPLAMMQFIADGVRGYHAKGDRKESAIRAAAWMGADAASDIPGVRSMTDIAGAVRNPSSAPKVAGQLIGGLTGPVALAARAQDTVNGKLQKRYPGDDFLPNLEASIPVLRQTLPTQPAARQLQRHWERRR